jgi:hypothetical protein
MVALAAAVPITRMQAQAHKAILAVQLVMVSTALMVEVTTEQAAAVVQVRLAQQVHQMAEQAESDAPIR